MHKAELPNVAILDPVVDLLSDILGHERNSGRVAPADRAYFDRWVRLNLR